MEKRIYYYLYYHTIEEYRKLHPRGTQATVALPFSLARKKLEKEWGIKLDVSDSEYRGLAIEIKKAVQRGEV